MIRGSRLTRRLVTTAVVVGFTLIPLQAAADGEFEFATPLFGMAATSAGTLLVADAGAGIVEVNGDELTLLAELPGVTDVDPVRSGAMWAVGGAGNWGVYQVTGNHPRQIADLLEFETAVNPHPEAIDSNPFDIEATSRGAVVADAGGNTLLSIDFHGNVDWIAVLPDELVSTANIKGLAGCPTPVEGFEFVCELPDMMPAQPVATSVAIGPDGAYYVGELKGFPAPTNESRIWRIDPSAHHAECGVSPLCTVVVDGGFTSIVDLVFGPQGLYVTEIDEASWAAVEFQLGPVGGTVNVCNITTWNCSEVATGLDVPIATATTRGGDVFTALSGLFTGVGEIVDLS